MSKFLLTVFAFGLLLSSAFAQEKSSEQYREEQSHIFGIEGLESQTFTRVVASGAKQRIDVYVSLNPDCSATGDINVRVTKQPEHGTVETAVSTEYVHYPKENIRSKCNQHRVMALSISVSPSNRKTARSRLYQQPLSLPTQKTTSATSAMSTRLRECKSITSRRRNTSATIRSTYSSFTPPDLLGKFITT